MGVHDAMYILGGKWKISIMACLFFGPKRYSDILRNVKGISGKMLSRELKEMEVNQLIKRTVTSNQPITVIYEMTECGASTKPIVSVLAEWGETYRKQMIEKTPADI
ncbi:winged helix-turn-helix transcriptional regulator [Chitinophaga arvensicola]|nr:winged helix-turn-helix transcriptional regulator [Chitinophaga arvensicola]